MKRFKSVTLSALLILFVFAVNAASATDPIEINVIGMNYEYDGWSTEQYPIMDLFGEKYVPLFIENGELWNCRVNKLAKLVLDIDTNSFLKAGEKLDLGNGYTLEAKQFDVDGNKVWLEFSKDGQYVDDQIISVSGTSAEKTWTIALDNVQNEDNIVVMKVHINQIISDSSGFSAQIDGIWLIDYSNAMSLKLDDKLGIFKLTGIIDGVNASNLGKLIFEPVNNQLTFTETQITNNPEGQMQPDIYGNKLVWADHRNGDADIYMWDLSTYEETQITTNKSGQYFPAIYGDRIVWQDLRNDDGEFNNWDIYMYDMLTHDEIPVITDGSDQESPAIYQDRIVWVDDRNGNPDIYLYNLSTSEEKQITTDSSTQYSPAIYGDRIVWTDMRNGNSDIYMYNLSTSEETQITTDTSFQSDPAIYGDRIVWRDDRNGNWNIYMYDLSTSEETQITSNEMVQWFPKIYNNRIVWEDLRNENSDIYMYDISTATEIQITTDISDQQRPTISEDKIVWTDNRNGNLDIYMCTISENGIRPEPLLANFSTNVTSGTAPLNVSFTDASIGSPKFWNWDFGDGQNSTDKNPTHTYYLEGNYTAALTVTNEYCQDTKISEISVSAQRLIANFSGIPTFGKPPLEVKFSDYSKGLPTSWKWNFGDGACSSQKNPVHTYRKSGKYNVSLTVKNATESSTMRKTAYVDVRNHLDSETESKGAIFPGKISKS